MGVLNKPHSLSILFAPSRIQRPMALRWTTELMGGLVGHFPFDFELEQVESLAWHLRLGMTECLSWCFGLRAWLLSEIEGSWGERWVKLGE